MYNTRLFCLSILVVLVAASLATTQWGTRPDDMHIDQVGYPSPGSPVSLTFRVTGNPGPNLGYQAAMSQGWRGIPIPGGVVPLDPDAFFFLTATNSLPAVFSGFAGKLNPLGIASGAINIPPFPALNGTSLYMAFVIYDTKGKVQGISRAHKFQILDRPQTAVCGNTPLNNIEVVDLDGKTIVKAIPVGSFAQAPYYDLSCKHIIATTWAGWSYRIDTLTNQIVNTVQITGNSCVGGAAVMTSKGERYFVCNTNAATPSICEIDSASFKEVKNHLFPVNQERPAGLAPRPFSSEALVTCFLSTTGAIYKFDVESGAVATVVAPGTIDNPQDAVWRPQGDLVFVCEYGSATSTIATTPTIWAFDSNFQLKRKIKVGLKMPAAAGIAMAPDGSYFYCDVSGDSNIAKVDCDPASPGFGSVIKNIPIPGGFTSGGWMGRNYDGSKAYALLTTGLGELNTVTDKFSTSIIPTTSGAAIFNVRHHRQDL